MTVWILWVLGTGTNSFLPVCIQFFSLHWYHFFRYEEDNLNCGIPSNCYLIECLWRWCSCLSTDFSHISKLLFLQFCLVHPLCPSHEKLQRNAKFHLNLHLFLPLFQVREQESLLELSTGTIWNHMDCSYFGVFLYQLNQDMLHKCVDPMLVVLHLIWYMTMLSMVAGSDVIQACAVNRVAWSWFQCAVWISFWLDRVAFSEKSTCKRISSPLTLSLILLIYATWLGLIYMWI